MDVVEIDAASNTQVDRTREVVIDTGRGHGFLYLPLAEWMKPAVASTTMRSGESPRGVARPRVSVARSTRSKTKPSYDQMAVDVVAVQGNLKLDQRSVLFLVPIAVASGLILASASRFVRNDIDAIRSESVARAAAGR